MKAKKQKEKMIFNVVLLKIDENPFVARVYANSYHNALKHAEKKFNLDYYEQIIIEKIESVTGKGLYSKKQRAIG